MGGSADPLGSRICGGSGTRVVWLTAEMGLAELRFLADRSECAASIEAPALMSFGFGLEHVTVWDTDSLTVTAGYRNFTQARPDRCDARFVVTVYEANFTTFRKTISQNLPLLSASIGVTGALGVIGAAATAATPVVLVGQ